MASVVPLPVHVTPAKAAEVVPVRDVAAAHLRSLVRCAGGALAASAVLVPLVGCCGFLYSGHVSAMHDRGVNVRDDLRMGWGDSGSGDALLALKCAYLAVGFSIVFVCSLIAFRAFDVPLGREIKVSGAVLVLLPLITFAADPNGETPSYSVALVFGSVLLVVAVQRASAPLAVRLFLWAVAGSLLMSSGMAFVGVPYLVAADTPDWERVVVRSVAPLCVDAISAFFRLLARRTPRSEDVPGMLAFHGAAHAVISLYGRMSLLMISDARSLAWCLLAVSAVELLLRTTQQRRDSAVERWLGLPPSPHAAAVRASAIMIEEGTEILSALSTAAVFVFFRVGASAAAPSTLAVVQSVAAQVAVELAVDFLPLLGLVLGAPRLRAFLQRSLLSKSEAVAAWTRADMRILAFNVVAMTLILPMMIVAAPGRIMCPWSQHNGWWHFVPCAEPRLG